jgi:hypothetical protein
LPAIFGTALASNLKDFSANQYSCTLLKFIDDLLLAEQTQEDCMEVMHLLLSLLWEASYKVSRKKAQICQNTVKYLSFHLSQGNAGSALRGNSLYVPSQPLRPISKLESFWELQVSAESGSPNYSLLAKPLYEATKGGEQEALVWGREQEKAFKEIKKALPNAPALGLLDVVKPFFLYVHE